MMSRRGFLGGTAVAGVLAAAGIARMGGKAGAAEGEFEVTKTKAEWKTELTPEQYYVLREAGTERAGSSPLNGEKRAGTFHCGGCDLALFSSDTKFESGTGWPSFTAPLENAVGTSADRGFFTTRTEVHCRRCGGHLGHVFDDGPPPTGKRYCMNGVAMMFRAAAPA
ncbi:MAG: peptide-methionine (R)-S-oxide reductase [Alphaproteobacteria bacterium HGW-Alphaproteobacteria-12]|nr:MAG: peptide-methionine (R)-S-oxide reductase [Alphaproteobacteria bacterium HGW-Alphaproteobacteria-12]